MSENVWQSNTGPQASTQEEYMLRGYNPLKEFYHWQLIISMITGGLVTLTYILLPGVNNASFLYTQAWSLPVSLILLLCFFLVWVGLPLWSFLRYRHIRQKRDMLRMAAFRGQSLPLASFQPMPFQPTPFYQRVLPLRLESHLKKGLVIWTGLESLLVGIDWLMNYADYNHLWTMPTFLSSYSPLLGMALGYALIGISMAIQNRIRGFYLLPWLQVDDQGITASYGRDTIAMRWQDIRYFALANTILWRRASTKSAEKAKKFDVFEISDGENMICWQVNAPPSAYCLRLFSEAVRSPQIYEVFTQQMASLIIERTGLPLCDFRG